MKEYVKKAIIGETFNSVCWYEFKAGGGMHRPLSAKVAENLCTVINVDGHK